MTTTETLTGPFADYLRANRERLNSLFLMERHIRPALEGRAFIDLLRTTIAPLADAIAHVEPSSTGETLETLYILALDLLGQELLGGKSRYPFITQGWQMLFPSLAKHIAAAPRQVTGALTNALYNLSLTPGARPAEWLETMSAAGPRCSDVETLLRLGQVAAWRAGLAHYRYGALDLCMKLEPALACAALRIAPIITPASMDPVLERMTVEPWLDPAEAAEPRSRRSELTLVARVGAFRGFGGLFLAPPLVGAAGSQFIVRDGDNRWLLTADFFGATFHRSDTSKVSQGSGPFQLDRSGKVTLGRASKVFSELADFTSVAANENTLAVTSPLSHAVYLVALV
jgi:hypothetical protein